MSEEARITQVFDNWYYKGLSITNQKSPIKPDLYFTLLSDFMKWSCIFGSLFSTGHADLPNYKILDAGCGNGNALRTVIEFGAKPTNCYGIDISSKAIEYARENSPAGLTYDTGLIHDIPHENETFDLIFCFGVLIHILDDDYIRKIASEFKRLIKKTGMVCVIVSNEKVIWGSPISHITRNFDFSKNELANIFNELDCIAAIPCYIGTFPPGYSIARIFTELYEQKLPLNFILVLFKKR